MASTSVSAPRPEVRDAVKGLLTRSAAFASLSPERQQQVARDTAMVADYLAAPEGIPGHTLAGGLNAPSRAMADPPSQASFKDANKAVDAIGQEEFKAGAAMAGAQVAGEFMRQVNFVEFVSGLIQGVFHSIITANIEQMEAYSKLVADVSKSLNQFRDENTTENQGRDHMADTFPDVFEIGVDDMDDTPTPRLKLRDDVDEASALQRINDALGGQEGGAIKSLDVSDPAAEAKLIQAARSHIATSRQQLLATMVLMGLSRIVVTDGKLSAKIVYDFQAKDSRKLSRSASAFDYARDASGNLAKTRSSEGEYDSGGTSKGTNSGEYERGRGNYSRDYDADYYSKGKYKYAEKPIMTAQSTATDAQDSSLSVKAQLAGNVEVNFKSDYLPLDKMATPEMMAALQMRSKPVDHNRMVYGEPAPTAKAPAAAAPPAA